MKTAGGGRVRKAQPHHVGLLPHFEKPEEHPDGDGSLLDHSMILYGSPMGDSNVHNHKRVPLILVGTPTD